MLNECIITLTTDFGTQDHYVSVMKVVILGIAPSARLIDISHDIPLKILWRGHGLLETQRLHFQKGAYI